MSLSLNLNKQRFYQAFFLLNILVYYNHLKKYVLKLRILFCLRIK